MGGHFDTTVKLTGKLAYFELERSIDRLAPLLGADQPLTFRLDLGNVDFVSPAGMALIRCALQRLQHRGLTRKGSAVVLPNNQNVARYVRRMDALRNLVTFINDEDFDRHEPQGFLPTEEFTNGNAAGMAAFHIVKSFDISDNATSCRLQCNLSEITENAVYHSEADYGFVIAQRWSQKKTVEFAIADYGIGVAESIRRNPLHRNLGDCAAMDVALKLGGTGVDNRRRGQGLWTVAQAVERNGGHMLIRSGCVRYKQRAAERSVRTFPTVLPGTLVAMRFDLARPLDIGDILSSVPRSGEFGFISFED